MQSFRAELHVHTVLSPCAEVEMIPPFIVRESIDKGINLLAITDHNASANVESVIKAAEGTGLKVLPGMEVQTREEVHMLCLFDTLEQLEQWQAQVDTLLAPIENDIGHFGEQFVVDETGDFIRREEQLLLTSAGISFQDAVAAVSHIGGLSIPAHVDRKAFSLLANLGFVPEGVPITAIEITRHLTPDHARQKYPQIVGYPLVQNGDVHRLDEFLGANHFWVKAPTVEELRLALLNREGRSHLIRGNPAAPTPAHSKFQGFDQKGQM